MSGPRSLAYRHFQRAIERWPKDRLRPDCQLQDALARRIEAPAGGVAGASSREEIKQVNAMYSLLEDRYKNKYRILGQLMEPRSNPTYYADVIREIEEAPTRTWVQRIAKRLGGMVRLQ